MNIRHQVLSAVMGLLYAATTAAAPVYAVDGTAPQRNTQTFTDCRADFPLVTLDQIPSGKRTGMPGIRSAASSGVPTAEKTIPLLVISVGFANVTYNSDQNVSQMFFEDAKSVSQYFHDQSYGQFTYSPAPETCAAGAAGNTNTADQVNDGVVHVTLKTDHADWADLVSHETTDEDQKAAYATEYAKSLFPALSEALRQADAYVDFAFFDKNGDGKIQTSELALCFQFAGSEASEVDDADYKTVDRKKLFWSNASSLENLIQNAELEDTEVPKLDGVSVSDYIGVAELRDNTNFNGTAVICHELGHYLGLPDLYDTAYTENAEWSTYQVNNLSLMCSGNGVKDPDGEGYLQASLDMWSKIQLGWVKPQVATRSGTYTISATDYDNIGKEHRALRINTANPNEYYLIENRQPVKWDKGLTPALHEADAEKKNDTVWNQDGLILWHVDMTNYATYEPDNTLNVATHRPCVMPLFGELKEAGVADYTILGIEADSNCGFFSKEIWESRYAENLGNTLELPVYGTGSDADKRSARKGSGIKIQFLSSSGADMSVSVTLKGDTEPASSTDTTETTETTETTVTTETTETTVTTDSTAETTETTVTTDSTAETTETTVTTDSTAETTAASTEATTTDPLSARVTYSLDALCAMALDDYEQKNGSRPANASAFVDANGMVNVQLSNERDYPMATYIVDPVTAKGTDTNGNTVDLPQTGNTSTTAAAVAGSALLLTVGGLFTMLKSGMLRKKDEE